MHLSYCTNVHPAEDLAGVLDQLDRYAGPARVAAGLDRLGVGLWLPVDLAAQLAANPADLAALADGLRRNRLDLRTVNAFPYQGFHADVVKLAVYHPDWTDPRRADFTIDCARVLARLLPAGGCGSISTLPLAWRTPWDADRDRLATAQLARVGRELADIHARTGRLVRLAVEPEPGCVLDNLDDVTNWLAAKTAADRPPPDRLDPRYIGICLDACHLAVSFADPLAAVRRVHESGLRIAKVQASAALEVPRPADGDARAAVREFAEPRYLHQVRECSGAVVLRADDLPQALTDLPADGPWRVHFHVPLHHRPEWPLRATTDVLVDVMQVLHQLPYRNEIHLDVETYTWNVLPAAARTTDLADGIAAELRWAAEHLLVPATGLPEAGPARPEPIGARG